MGRATGLGSQKEGKELSCGHNELPTPRARGWGKGIGLGWGRKTGRVPGLKRQPSRVDQGVGVRASHFLAASPWGNSFQPD